MNSNHGGVQHVLNYVSGEIGRLPVRVEQAILKATAGTGIDPNFVCKLCAVESGGNPAAVSRAGARGLFQFMPHTARKYGVKNPHDIEDSLRGCIKSLREGIGELTDIFERPPTETELYTCWWQQGEGGGPALARNLDKNAVQTLRRFYTPATAKRAIVHNGGSPHMTAREYIYDVWGNRIGNNPVVQPNPGNPGGGHPKQAPDIDAVVHLPPDSSHTTAGKTETAPAPPPEESGFPGNVFRAIAGFFGAGGGDDRVDTSALKSTLAPPAEPAKARHAQPASRPPPAPQPDQHSGWNG